LKQTQKPEEGENHGSREKSQRVKKEEVSEGKEMGRRERE